MPLPVQTGTQKASISRPENHAGDMRLPTLRKRTAAPGLRPEMRPG